MPLYSPSTGIAVAQYYTSKTRTAGNVSVPYASAGTLSDFDANTDLTVAAKIGDVINIGINCQLGDGQAGSVEFNFGTIVNGAVVNMYAAGTIPSWSMRANDYWPASNSVRYTVKAADLSNGTVTFRLRARTDGSSGTAARTVLANTNQPFAWDAFNMGSLTALASTAPTPSYGPFYTNGAANSKWRAAVARVKAGSGRGKVVVLSDSVYSTGQGAGTGAANLTGARQLRQSIFAAQTLTNAGIRAYDRGIVGDNGVTQQTSFINYDGRFGYDGGTSWSFDYSNNKAPGLCYIHPDTAGTTAVFDFSALAYDRVEIVFADYSTASMIYANDRGGGQNDGVITVNLTNSGAFVRALATCTKGTNKMRVVQSSGAQTSLISITPYDSTLPAIDFKVHGGCGCSSTFFQNSNSFYDSFHFIGYEAADLYVVALDINDYNQNLTVQQHTANIDAIVTECLKYGDVLLVSEHDTNLGASEAVRQSFADANKSYAANKGIAHYSFFEALGAYSSYSSQLVDGVHGNAQFNQNRGNDLGNIYVRMCS